MANSGDSQLDPLFSAVKRFFVVGCMFDHADDVNECLLITNPVCLDEVFEREPLRGGCQLLAQLCQRLRVPIPRTAQQDADRLDVSRVLTYERCKSREV